MAKISDHLGFEPRVSPHHLRHAYASHQLDLGVDLRVLQLVLGHASPKSTAHYVTLSEGGLQRLPSPLDALGTRKGHRLG